MKTKLYEIDWDTDNEVIEELPKRVRIPSDIAEDDIADWLSDKYGWCVNSFYLVKEDEKTSLLNEINDYFRDIENVGSDMGTSRLIDYFSDANELLYKAKEFLKK